MSDALLAILNRTSIYVIALTRDGRPCAPVKVGISTGVSGRLANLQTANPYTLELVCALHLPREVALLAERLFHESHDEVRLSGEWFDLEPNPAIAELCLYVTQAFKKVGCGDLRGAVIEHGVAAEYLRVGRVQ